MTLPISLLPAWGVWFCDGRLVSTKKIAPGSFRNDDRRPARPLYTPFLSFFIAPPAKSSTLVADIAPHKMHQTSAASGLLPWPVGERPVHVSAESVAPDQHPRTTAGVGDVRSR